MASAGTTARSVAGDAEGSAEDARLARAAAAGDGAAFATLYDRYEQRIFTFCQRLLASPDDAADATQEAFLKVLARLPSLEGRELNFAAYLYTAARNASYDVIGRRKKAEPTDTLPERGGGLGTRDPGDLDLDPERMVLLAAQQSEIQAANARLPERQREVLALRELDELSYDEIAEIMGMNRNSVAQLISRARIKLREELQGGALAAIATASPDCDRALPLIAARDDAQAGAADLAWLAGHLRTCGSCRASAEAMAEAGASYRAWLPASLVGFEWLRDATVARAAEIVGADWSQVPPRADPTPGGAPKESAASGTPGRSSANGTAAANGAAGAATGAAVGARSRRRRALLAAAVALPIVIAGVLAYEFAGHDGPGMPAASPAAATTAAPPASQDAAGGAKPTTTGAAEAPADTPADATGGGSSSGSPSSGGSSSGSGGSTPRRTSAARPRTTTKQGSQVDTPAGVDTPTGGSPGAGTPASPPSTGAPPSSPPTSGTPPAAAPPSTTPPSSTPPSSVPPSRPPGSSGGGSTPGGPACSTPLCPGR